MSLFGNNIRKIRNVKNMSQQAFADIFDLKRATLGAYEEGRSEPKIDTLLKIANYFSITVDDLLKKELTVNELLKFKGDISLTTEQYLKEKLASVPYITEHNCIDYIAHFEDHDYLNHLPLLNLPINTQKRFIAYTIMSLEMTNHDHGLFPKDIVIGEFVPKNIIPKINNGSIVLALVDNKLILRRLYVTGDYILLRADHKSIDDITVALTNIKQLWKIRYVFYRRIPEQNTSKGLEDKLNFLEQEFLKLKNNI
ncbi:helix-turn-helix domain-containing protein [Zhouia sp. PK063]|uniref:helix-turn-helix domain-containing protein n=1 Tax=Zhouia sp. PK063 TaxID=3373602 RepID=UPI003794F9FC